MERTYLVRSRVFAESSISVYAKDLEQISMLMQLYSLLGIPPTYHVFNRQLRNSAVTLYDFLRQTFDEGFPVLFGSAIIRIVRYRADVSSYSNI